MVALPFTVHCILVATRFTRSTSQTPLDISPSVCLTSATAVQAVTMSHLHYCDLLLPNFQTPCFLIFYHSHREMCLTCSSDPRTPDLTTFSQSRSEVQTLKHGLLALCNLTWDTCHFIPHHSPLLCGHAFQGFCGSQNMPNSLVLLCLCTCCSLDAAHCSLPSLPDSLSHSSKLKVGIIVSDPPE